MDGIILPGGESTTILKLMDRFGTDVAIKAAHAAGVPIYGTCAGLICISTEIETGSQSREGQTPLALLDATVTRNGFGTQLDSFETDLTIDGLDDGVFRAIFIRAPMISKLGRSVETLAIYNGKPVLVRNGNVLASTFHPELSNDLRIHKYFAQICDQR